MPVGSDIKRKEGTYSLSRPVGDNSSLNFELNPERGSAFLRYNRTFQDGGPVNKIQDDGALQGIKDFFLEQMKRSGERTAQMAEAQTKLPTPSAGQVANFAAMLAPGAGIYDAKQGWSALPSGKQPLSEAFSGEKSHTFDENLARGGIKGYGSAFLQGLGVVGDGAWGIPLAGAVVGPTVGTMLKTPAIIAKAAKAALKAIKTPVDEIDEGIGALSRVKVSQQAKIDVIDEYAQNHPTSFNKLFDSGASRISRKKFEAGDETTINKAYVKIRLKQEGMKRYKEAEKASKSRKKLFRPSSSKVKPILEKLGYKSQIGPKIPNEPQFMGHSVSEYEGISYFSDYYIHPETGKTVRVSDHAPVHQRSNRDVMIHPGSFESYDDITDALALKLPRLAETGIGALSRSDEGKGIATLTAQRAGKDIDQGIGALDTNLLAVQPPIRTKEIYQEFGINEVRKAEAALKRKQGDLDSVEDMVQRANTVNPSFQANIDSVAKSVGGKKADKFINLKDGSQFDVEVKTPKSIATKIKRRGLAPADFTDGVRTTIYIDTADQAEEAVSQIGQMYTTIDRGWQRIPESGYFDRKMNILVPDKNGKMIVAEIQIKTPEMFDAGEQGAHRWYDYSRRLEGRYNHEIPGTKLKLYNKALAEQRRLFGAAFDAADPAIVEQLVDKFMKGGVVEAGPQSFRISFQNWA